MGQDQRGGGGQEGVTVLSSLRGGDTILHVILFHDDLG